MLFRLVRFKEDSVQNPEKTHHEAQTAPPVQRMIDEIDGLD